MVVPVNQLDFEFFVNVNANGFMVTDVAEMCGELCGCKCGLWELVWGQQGPPCCSGCCGSLSSRIVDGPSVPTGHDQHAGVPGRGASRGFVHVVEPFVRCEERRCRQNPGDTIATRQNFPQKILLFIVLHHTTRTTCHTRDTVTTIRHQRGSSATALDVRCVASQ